MNKNSKISLYKLKKIIEYFCTDIDATKTSILLKINRNTINFYFNLFRESIYEYRQIEFESLFGHIEMDESYFGSKRIRGFHGKRKRGRGTLKQPVFGILQRDGSVYTEIIPDCKRKTLQDIIRGKVDIKETTVYTDGWRGYNGLVDVGYDKHFRVNHGNNEFSKGNGIHINGIENFWSFTKRRLSKFNGVKSKFHLHLKESEWRYKKTNLQLQTELIKIMKKYLKK